MRGETSNRILQFGLAGGELQLKMVHLEGETSNTILDVLADWEDQLKHIDIDFEELSND